MRRITWMRQSAKPDYVFAHEIDGKPTISFNDLGFERVNDYPAYDNGSYVVVDTVKDVNWAVLVALPDGRLSIMKDHFISKYEAIEYADDLLESDQRRQHE